MTDFDLVQVLDSCQYLVEEAASLRVLQAPFLDNIVEELTARGILHNQEQLLACLNDFIELHNIWVAHDLQDMDFTHHSSDVRLVLDHVFFENFDCDFFVSQLVNAFSNFSKRAFSNSLADKIVPDESIIGDFLTTLSGLPVTFFAFGFLELGERLPQRRLQPLPLRHLGGIGWLRAALLSGAAAAGVPRPTRIVLASLRVGGCPSLNSLCHWTYNLNNYYESI